jgi:hypothetical protein
MIKLNAGIKNSKTMANITIKNDKSPHERFFGTPSPIKP